MPRKRIQPRPHMTSHGPAYKAAHYVCPDCGDVFKLPSDGAAHTLPWCNHGGNYTWRLPEGVSTEKDRPRHASWSRMMYAEVLPGPPRANGDAWGEET